MFDFLFTLSIIYILIYFSKKDFLDILNTKNLPEFISDKVIHIYSAEKLLYFYRKGESIYGIFYIFRYQFLFISLIILFNLKIYFQGYSNIFILSISAFSIVAMFLNFILPLKQIYLVAIKESLSSGISIKDWFILSFKYISREFDISNVEISSVEILKIREVLRKLTINDYKVYVSLLLSIESGVEPLSEQEYKNYLIVMSDTDILCRKNNRLTTLYLSSETISLMYAGIYNKSIDFKLNKPSSFERKLLERYADIALLFSILHIVTYWR